MAKITTKNLLSAFKVLDAKTARMIVRLCNGTMDPEDFDAGADLVRRCYNRPDDTHLILTVVADLLTPHGAYGTDSAPYETGAMYTEDFISYVNMGDTYAATVLWSPDGGFQLTSFGDAYERSPACADARAEDEDELANA